MNTHSIDEFVFNTSVRETTTEKVSVPHKELSKDSDDDDEKRTPLNITTKKYYESNAGDGTIATDHHLQGTQLWLTLASCFITLFVSALDQTIVVTIFSTVGNEFNAFDRIDWLTSGYLLPMCVLSPTYGKISIAFGRKSTLIAGISVFEIGSIISALATSMDMLIAGRVVQGLGAGCIATLISIIVTESVPISYRSYSLSMLAIAYAFASVAGPFIGGAFTTHVTWRWNFYLNLPTGGISLLILIFSYHPPKIRGRFIDNVKKIDYLGNILLILGLVLFLLGLTFGGSSFAWFSAPVLICLIFGVFFIVAFAFENFFVSKSPIFYKEFFQIPQILFSGLSGFFNYAFFLGNITYLTVYFQIILNHSAFQSGIDLLPLIISVTIAAFINGVLIKKTRFVKPYYILSGVFGAIGGGLLLMLGRETPFHKRMGYLIAMGCSVGLQIQSTIISCQLKAPNDLTGSLILVTTWANFSRFLGGTMGIILATVIFQASSTSSITKIIEALPYETKKQFANISAQAFLSSPKEIQKLPVDVQQQIFDKLMEAIHNTFIFGLASASTGLVCSIFATNKRIPKDEDILHKGDETEALVPSSEA
ncbi:major facilitator superfamily domain-containing protein [Scheffersomyces coipomensis]|uniref:major facilitator superfamily domain-containing protein n=1 Tax=Scheffersomyces coipomensis TaxID=1788519 RepID=UPI00315D2B2C